jgi:hypothetical protein
MNKLTLLWKIIKDRWVRPYDTIVLRFNTKALEGDPLVWRVFVNGNLITDMVLIRCGNRFLR